MLRKECLMDKKQEASIDILIADIMIRLTTMEKLLVAKGVFTQEEYIKELELLATNVAQVVLDKANNSENLEEFISNMESKKDN